MIDVTHQISAVQRRVGTRTLEAGEARIVVISQTYDAAVEDVWDACTNAERIPAMVPPGLGRAQARRPLPARGQRRRHHRAV